MDLPLAYNDFLSPCKKVLFILFAYTRKIVWLNSSYNSLIENEKYRCFLIIIKNIAINTTTSFVQQQPWDGMGQHTFVLSMRQ